MTTNFTAKEIGKIINDKKLVFPLNLAMASAWILGNQKGESLKILDVKHISSLADYFVIASATNSTQARSMADHISDELKKHGHSPRSIEGSNESDWILIDFGDIIVHIFLDYARPVYDLDDVWKDAKRINIPTDYYFSNPEVTTSAKKTSVSDSDKNYF